MTVQRLPSFLVVSPADHEEVVAEGVRECALDEARVGVGGALQHGVPPLPLVHPLVRLVGQQLKL